jgi:hypothetical protein
VIPETLEALKVPVDDLRPYGRNPRQGDVGAIVSSLERHGQYRPIVVNARTREVLAGNHTLRAARELGWTEIAATFVDVDEDTAARIVLIDNRSNDLAAYDDQALVDLLRSLPDLDGTGYTGGDLDELLEVLDPPARTSGETDAGNVPPDPKTRAGDLYELGGHRLLCGDSANTEHLDRLYADAAVGCVLTDPPYGMNLDTDYTSMGSGSKKAVLRGTTPKSYRPVIGDDQQFDASLLIEYFSGVGEQFWFGADYYRRTLSASDRDGSWLVWDKRNEASDAGFGSGFELVWSRTAHKRDLLRHYYFGAFGVEGSGRVHPTQKPTPMLCEILNRWVPEGAAVADPFAGSGSTLIACEKTGRSCYTSELDPGYVDVIRQRYADHVGDASLAP